MNIYDLNTGRIFAFEGENEKTGASLWNNPYTQEERKISLSQREVPPKH